MCLCINGVNYPYYVGQLYSEESEDVEPRTKLRLIVPNSSCGGIIGKQGSTIK